ncbi:hypothetical protein BBJ29_002756 [Phytophthora kernoviae]|uniref:Origin recognition complex subunit 3 winged helix C-terminal domain-containing protein n=1 Tax=Phytophthora kernoviae TaxID=325452 RepID=A0A3F2RK25_9STRA|nr:hypothetical protein BBJ29_002756 [Phytophthora kernoviae]RLN58944.1 hypothetical protein BBP00_00006763 [Phytophthora kernoviae]
MHGGSTELALALVLQSVLRQYAMFLKTTKLEWKGMNDRRKDVAQKLSQHEYKYELLRASTKKDDELPGKLSSAPRPFLMLCIEQLEAFSQHVLDGLDDGKDLSVVPLALALDGRLDWQSSFRRFAILEDEGEDLDTKLSELVLLCEYTASEKPPANMQVALRQELSDMLTDHLVSALLYPPAPGVMSPADKLVAKWTVLTDASVLDERLRFEYHDKLHNVLEEAGIGDRGDAVSDTSWVHDVGLAFLFYTESASASLSLSEWYNSFSTELMEEAKPAQSKNKKRKKTEDDTEIKARFVRAICTLRQWGFLKSDAPRDLEQDIVEKLVFI